jgi:hypothetical protein
MDTYPCNNHVKARVEHILPKFFTSLFITLITAGLFLDYLTPRTATRRRELQTPRHKRTLNPCRSSVHDGPSSAPMFHKFPSCPSDHLAQPLLQISTSYKHSSNLGQSIQPSSIVIEATMGAVGNLIPLVILFLVVGGASWVGYQVCNLNLLQNLEPQRLLRTTFPISFEAFVHTYDIYVYTYTNTITNNIPSPTTDIPLLQPTRQPRRPQNGKEKHRRVERRGARRGQGDAG